MKNISKWVWIAAVLAVLAVSLMSTENALQKPGVVIPFSQFTKLVEQNTIREVSIDGNQATATLRARTSLDGNLESVDRVRTVFPKEMEQNLFEIMLGNDVAVWFKPTEDNNAWYRIIIPWILILGVYFFLVRRMQGNLLDRFGGRSLKDFLQGSAVEEAKSTRKVTFKDVAGQENAKREVSELVDFLKNPDAYQKLGADPPRGVLLMGPPGTGKTLMARALAGEAGVNFFHISASEFIEMFVGVGASRVRKMFEEARKRAPSIIFIDELDAVGRVRGTGMGGGNDEREQTLNQILSELDGFSGHETVIVLAATNRPDVLDPALLRPGRFDRHITLELPDKLARMEILTVHTRDVPLANDVDLGTVAANCPGFSGADLKNLVNEASIAAAREGSDEVTMHHFDQMRDRIIMGTVRTLAIQQDEHHRLAVHEAGHTAVAWYLPNTDPVYKVTIIPRGRALGGTHMLPEKERHTLSEDHLRARLAVTLGGRCSEKHFLGNVSSGADDDIQSATQIARAMVTRWGMSEDIGPVDLRQSDEHPFLGREIAQPRHFSEAMANKVDESVSELLDYAEKTAHKIIEDHAQQISELVSVLEKEETLEQSEIGKILNAKSANSVLVDASQTFIKPD